MTTHEPDTKTGASAVIAGACILAVAILVWWSACAPDRLLGPRTADAGDGPYAPGDTMRYFAECFDSSGKLFTPDSANVDFMYFDVRIARHTLAAGDMTVDGTGRLVGDYVIPSTWSHSWTLTLVGEYDGDGWDDEDIVVGPMFSRVNARTAYVDQVTFVDSSRVVADLTEAFPTFIDSVRSVGTTAELTEEISGGSFDGGYIDSVGLVLLLDEEFPTFIDSVRAVGTTAEVTETITASAVVDTIAPSAVNDLFTGIASESYVYVTSESCEGCSLEVSGSLVTDGQVFIMADSNAVSLASIRGYTDQVVEGRWKANTRVVPGVPDTLWVRFNRFGAFLPRAYRVVIP